jgi:hypothetical protein
LTGEPCIVVRWPLEGAPRVAFENVEDESALRRLLAWLLGDRAMGARVGEPIVYALAAELQKQLETSDLRGGS